MDEIKKNILKSINLSKEIRMTVLNLSFRSKASHLASCLSCVDIVGAIFANFYKGKNKFILSKGHAAMVLYSVLYHKNFISKKKLNSYCDIGSPFEEHPSPKIPHVDFPTGSLGHGLAAACGIGLGYKINNFKSKIFVLMSDGECNEGTIWESLLFASAKKISNLVIFVDYNKWQATGRSNEVLKLNSLKKKFQSFNWFVQEIDGHDHKKLYKSIIKTNNSSKPSIIIANTIKGKGVSFMEDDNNWHYKIPTSIEFQKALEEIRKS